LHVVDAEIKTLYTIQAEVAFSSQLSFVRNIVRNWRKKPALNHLIEYHSYGQPSGFT